MDDMTRIVDRIVKLENRLQELEMPGDKYKLGYVHGWEDASKTFQKAILEIFTSNSMEVDL